MQHTARWQFLRFAMVGAAGFLVDTGALYFALWALGTGPYAGRLFSYLVAATATWALNRRYTFHTQRSANRAGEWAKFLAANVAGGLANYAVYAALVFASAIVAAWPVLGVAAGSLSGLAINFALSRRVVFTGGPTQP